MNRLENCNVTASEWNAISAILLRHVPEREVWAFGSRVKGTVKKFSDLDLAILGDRPLPLGTLASLADDFSESDLIYKVDIVDWALTTLAFRETIRKRHVVVQLPAALRN